MSILGQKTGSASPTRQDRIKNILTQISLLSLMLVPAIAVCVSAHRPALAAQCSTMAEPELDWSKCGKKNLMLGGSNLEKANLSEADFSMTDLSYVNIKGANLEKTLLARSWLTGAHAEKANFSRIEAYRSGFVNIIADGATFAGAELQRANFSGAHLTGVDFEKAELGRANFQKAILTGTRFSLANLSRADLTNSVFEGPIAFDRAFLFLTHIEGLDLSAATGLEQEQIDISCGDEKTKLPPTLKTPGAWPCDAE